MRYYTVKEIFYTLQGEGYYAGRAAVFCRFSGCNLWSGREQDRTKAVCSFCDTDFVGTGIEGGKFTTAAALAQQIANLWPCVSGVPFVVFTGGEPLLQLDEPLIKAMHQQGFEVAVETNGTIAVPMGIDWICVSPKGGAPLQQRTGNELKLVYPQINQTPESVSKLDFIRWYLQPMDGPQRNEHTQAAIKYCMAHPKWMLSLQIHKMVNIR